MNIRVATASYTRHPDSRRNDTIRANDEGICQGLCLKESESVYSIEQEKNENNLLYRPGFFFLSVTELHFPLS